MRIPVVKGVIERRILVNYRVEPEVLARTLPPPFRPKLHDGHGLAGICLIRLREIRPWLLPGFVGLSSENAAHRTAVEWDGPNGVHQGVFVRRRDSSSRINSLLGGRLFPGVHHHARFQFREAGDAYDIRVRSDDGQVALHVHGQATENMPTDSIFRSLEAASAFFERGSVGYSPARSAESFDGLELRSFNWRISPLAIDDVHSSHFDDQSVFPPGTAVFDCALLMRDIKHEWHSREPLCCTDAS